MPVRLVSVAPGPDADHASLQAPPDEAASAGTGPGDVAASRTAVVFSANAVRISAHFAVALPFVAATFYLLRQRWQPVADAAAIALRSWNILTPHAPLVGQATRLAVGTFDPGPLEYWLLTLPEHLDPGHGSLWGSQLWCVVAVSLAVGAAWSAAGAVGALGAAGTVLAAIAWMPGIALQPLWNPWFGLVFLLAAMAAAWAVIRGKHWWWPVLAITASVATQAHLLFALASVVLVLVAFGVGLADAIARRSGLRWAVAGLLAGAVCWIAPVYQELNGPRGNLTALLHGQGASGQHTGLIFGLRALAGAAGVPPLWWRPLQPLVDLNVIRTESAVVGLAALIIMALVIAAAIWPLRSRALAALAAVTFATSASAVVTYANISVQGIPVLPSPLDTLNYLMILMAPVGVTCWLTVSAAIVLLGRRLLASRARPAASHRSPRAGAPRVSGRGSWFSRTAPLRAARTIGIVSVALLSLATARVTLASASQFPGVADARYARVVSTAAREIENRLGRQPLAITIASPDEGYRKRRLLLGLAWVLTTRGYGTKLSQRGWELGPSYVMRPGMKVTRVQVQISTGGVTLRINRRLASG